MVKKYSFKRGITALHFGENYSSLAIWFSYAFIQCFDTAGWRQERNPVRKNRTLIPKVLFHNTQRKKTQRRPVYPHLQLSTHGMWMRI